MAHVVGDQARGVHAKCNVAYVIEAKSLQHVLKIDDFVLIARGGEVRDEAVRDLGRDGFGDEVFERLGVEFVACDLALESPEMGVDVEDAVAEELGEDVVEARAFDVVLEVGVEEVLDIGGVGGADAMGEVEEGADSESG